MEGATLKAAANAALLLFLALCRLSPHSDNGNEGNSLCLTINSASPFLKNIIAVVAFVAFVQVPAECKQGMLRSLWPFNRSCRPESHARIEANDRIL
jgi:hypothetical protein